MCIHFGTKLSIPRVVANMSLASLAWPDPSCSRKGEEEKGGGGKEEGSGDSEQDAVSQWNVIIKLILRIT